MALTERLKLLAGARFERFEHKYKTFVTDTGNWNVSDSAVTPRLGMIYDLTDTVAVYANTARSFKPNTGRSSAGEGSSRKKASPSKWASSGKPWIAS